jgi:hypothetical protein
MEPQELTEREQRGGDNGSTVVVLAVAFVFAVHYVVPSQVKDSISNAVSLLQAQSAPKSP